MSGDRWWADAKQPNPSSQPGFDDPAITDFFKGFSNHALGQLKLWLEQEQGSSSAPTAGHYEIKLFADDEEVTSGFTRLTFEIPDDLDGTHLVFARAFVSTASSSGNITVNIRNLTESWYMLADDMTIDQGDLSSFTSDGDGTFYGHTFNLVHEGDQLVPQVFHDGTGAKGLGVILRFA